MTRESDSFNFCPFEPAEFWDEINRLDTTKKTIGDVPTHVLKLTSDLSFSAVTKLANEIVQQCTFPDDSPVCKSDDTALKNTYRQWRLVNGACWAMPPQGKCINDISTQ